MEIKDTVINTKFSCCPAANRENCQNILQNILEGIFLLLGYSKNTKSVRDRM